MADTIKIGNTDISAFKVGSGDCSIYLGSVLVCSGGTTPPTPTGFTYSVTITGLENGDTTNIAWNYGDHIDSNVGNGTYTYNTSNDTAFVTIDQVTDYTVDYNIFTLYSGGSQTVTFTYQGGGGGLVEIPYGTDMSQYYGQYVRRFVVGDTSFTGSALLFNNWTDDYLYMSPWDIIGNGQFASISSLPIDITLSGAGAQLNVWTFDNTTENHFNDLQIEWA